MIFGYGAQGAALGFVLLPLVAASAAVPIGIGAALGHVAVLHLRGSSEPKILFRGARRRTVVPAVVGSQIWRGRALEAAVQEVRAMNSAELERAFQESPFAHDKYFLGALAQHPGASAALSRESQALTIRRFPAHVVALGRDGRTAAAPP